MCGILGLVAPPNRRVEIEQRDIVAMRDRMVARGPDDAGLVEHRNVVFAHRRLAIRDLEGGRQPWASEDGRCLLVYNGEIYNDCELREELTTLGHTFRSRCDTEVVMEAYRRWGSDCVGRLRGMFAFGLYDFEHDRLLLVRDRVGTKPLFFSHVNGNLIFASSIAALLRHPHLSRSPNLQTLSHYLTTFRITLGQQTMFEGIEQLQPGELLLWERGEQRITRYWEIPGEQSRYVEYAAAVEELETLLTDSVSRRLISDVPVGAFISGGVDSNTILAMIRDDRASGLKTFCGGAEGDSPDFEFASRSAGQLDCDYDEVHVSEQQYLQTWQQLVGEQHLPLSTPTDVIIYQLATQMKRSVGVALGGEGADELLCGYAVQHYSSQDFESSCALRMGRWRGTSQQARQFSESLRAQYNRDFFTSEIDHFLALNSLIPAAAQSRLFQTWSWEQAGREEPIKQFYADLFAERAGESTAHKSAAVIHRVNLEGLLSRLDSATMAAGLEGRVPFTDHLLIERMFQLPTRYKIDVAPHEHAPHLSSATLANRGSLRSKRLLRDVARRRLTPDLANRQKASFPTPIAGWMGGTWRGWVRDTLESSPFALSIFREDALQELTENPQTAGMWLWPILNVSMWGDREFAAA